MPRIRCTLKKGTVKSNILFLPLSIVYVVGYIFFGQELLGKAQAVVVVPVVGVVVIAVSHAAVPRIVVQTTTPKNAVRASSYGCSL